MTEDNFWHFRLFVAGESPNGKSALEKLKVIGSTYLPGRHRIEVVDVRENASLLESERIVVLPTVVCKSPHSVRKVAGDLSRTGRVLVALGLAKEATSLKSKPMLNEPESVCANAPVRNDDEANIGEEFRTPG